MPTRPDPKTRGVGPILFILGALALSWPLLEIPLAACEAPQLSLSAELLRRCALQPLIWIYAVWVALLVLLFIMSRRRGAERRKRRGPPRE